MKLNEFGGSKTDTIVKLILVFFISLLSFSVGTFVGKQFSDSEHRLASLEAEYNKGTDSVENNNRETASIPGDHMEVEPTEILSKEDVAKLAEEFVADKPENKKEEAKRNVANLETHKESSPIATEKKEDSLDVSLRPVAEKVAKNEAPVKPIKPEVNKKAASPLPTTVAADIRGKYTIQVSSHQTESEAKSRAESLTTQGFVAAYVTAVVEGKTWYRVGVGSFNTVNTAKDYLSSVKDNPIFKGAIIRKLVDERTPSNTL